METFESEPWEPGDAEGKYVERAVNQAAHTLGVFAIDGRVLWVNETTLSQFGLSRSAVVGRPLDRLDWLTAQEPASPFADGRVLGGVVDLIREVASTGKVTHREVTTRTADDPRLATWDVTLTPVRDPAGTVRAVCGVVADITVQARARRQLVVLNRVGAHMADRLDVTHTAQVLADGLAPEICDVVSVDLHPGVVSGEDPPSTISSSQPIMMRRAAGQSALQLGTVPTAMHAYPSDSLPARSLTSGHTEHYRPGRDHRRDEASQMAIPLRTREGTLGVVVLARTRPEPFPPDDVLLVEELCARAAVSIDLARRFTRERNMALTLQRSLLPRDLRGYLAVEVASRYRPADTRSGVGGDWYDVIPLSSMRVALVIGDIVGHGLRASVAMGRLRTAVRTLADIDLAPDELLTHLDDLVARIADQEDTGGSSSIGEFGATCLYAVYDPVSCRLAMASAGHPPPVIVTPDGRRITVELDPGPPLGIGGHPFEITALTLPASSIVALYTDGLVAGENDDLDRAPRRLHNILSQTAISLEEAGDRMITTIPKGARKDDTALLLARTRALDKGRVASWDLLAEPSVVSEARRLACEQLAVWGLLDTFVTEMVVSELVTNAIRHAFPPIRLRLIRGEASLVCEVSDGASTAPHMRRAQTTDEDGRGLLLVAQLAQQWGARYTATGKTIWAKQDLVEL